MSFAALADPEARTGRRLHQQRVHGSAAAARLLEVLDAVPAVRDRANAIDPGRLQGIVEFDDVSFSYDGKRPAVVDLSLHCAARRNHRAGRLHRRRQVDRHRAAASRVRSAVRLHQDRRHGHPRRQLAALRRNIGVVFQEALLFNRSIADNLRVGKPDATDEELRVAADRAQALDFIERTEHGFDTDVGERGRIAVRRRAPAAVDRPRAAEGPADPDPRRGDQRARRRHRGARCNAALDEVMKGRTTFVIAHRLATIRNATRILVFDHGRRDRERHVRRAGRAGRTLCRSSQTHSSWCMKMRAPRSRPNKPA